MQVQNNKEEIPFAHYEEKFALLDPAEAAARCGFNSSSYFTAVFRKIRGITPKSLQTKSRRIENI